MSQRRKHFHKNPSLADHPLLQMLLKHQKGKAQVLAVMRGELTHLDFGYCGIGDIGAEIVASFLRYNETVIEVTLYDCNIGTRGAKAIAEALKSNKHLQALHLNDNEIGSAGGEALIKALQNFNVAIKRLYVFNSHMANGAEATLTHLAFTRNAKTIPGIVQKATLYLIAIRGTSNLEGMGMISCLPKDVVKMVAVEVWATRRDREWIAAVPPRDKLLTETNLCLLQ